MDEFECFLKDQRRKGLIKTIVWITILFTVTSAIVLSTFFAFDSGVKYILG